jgi:hypothetical protein
MTQPLKLKYCIGASAKRLYCNRFAEIIKSTYFLFHFFFKAKPWVTVAAFKSGRF